MDTFDIPLPADRNPEALPILIERVVAQAGLGARRFTLRSYPGATHWHLTRPGAPGTLELTYWPAAERLWLAVHSNRRADWIAPAIEALMERFLQAL